MKIMAVDLGKARTGVAASDPTESFAFPNCVITEYNEDRLVEKLVAKAKELSAELIVAGLPKNMDGSEGFRAEECRQTAEKLAKASGLEVVMWDERCTTVSAHAVLSMNDTRGKKRKEKVDAVAAVMILEDYLAFRKNRN
jgi:putative Holliday junction resolvase